MRARWRRRIRGRRIRRWRKRIVIRLHRLDHVGGHSGARRRIIIGRRIRRRPTGQGAIRPRPRMRRRRACKRSDRRIVGCSIRWRRHAHRPIGPGTWHDAIDRADCAGARIDDDANQDAAIVGGADHIGGAFAPRPRQRIVAGRAHDLGDLIRRHKTRQWGARWWCG